MSRWTQSSRARVAEIPFLGRPLKALNWTVRKKSNISHRGHSTATPRRGCCNRWLRCAVNLGYRLLDNNVHKGLHAERTFAGTESYTAKGGSGWASVGAGGPSSRWDVRTVRHIGDAWFLMTAHGRRLRVRAGPGGDDIGVVML